MGAHVTVLEKFSEGGRWRVGFCANEGNAGNVEWIEADHVISSAPMRELAACIQPALPAAVLEAAAKLRYRDSLGSHDRGIYDEKHPRLPGGVSRLQTMAK